MERVQGESDIKSLNTPVRDGQNKQARKTGKLKTKNHTWGGGVARITSNSMSYDYNSHAKYRSATTEDPDMYNKNLLPDPRRRRKALRTGETHGERG